jgi:hypothetical protein
MRHYDLADWLDYARGLGSTTVREAMARHADGCGKCAGTMTSVETVGAALVADEAAEPPPAVVRLARSVFSRFQPSNVVRLPRLLARLIDDGLAQPLAAGVRGHARAMRWVRYEAGEVLVHLRLEQRPGQPEVTLVGQLLEPDAFGLPVPRRPVVITAGRRILAATATNRHGEFLVDCTPARQLLLHIPVDDCARRVEIPLDALLARRSARAAAVTAPQPGQTPGGTSSTTA